MPDVKPTALPMREALAYWADKVPMTRPEFDELAEQMRARGFYVSGLNRLDQVEAVQASLFSSLSDGETFETWKSKIPEIIAQQNWSGTRLEMIYRTNVQSAYMAGRYAQMTRPEVLKARPYWRYSAINDGRTRPAHRAMDGRVFPADHPVWDTWYPPNGYRCRCGVDTLSAREAARDGLTVETEDPTGELFEPVDFRTGNRMPARPLMPDSGFLRNIGKEWTAGFSPTELDEKLEDFPLPAGIAEAVCRGGGGAVFAGGDICRPPLKGIDRRHVLPVAAGDILPAGLSDGDYVREFLGEFGLADIAAAKIHSLPGGVDVQISKGFFIDKATGQWKVQRYGRAPFVRLLARTILSPYEVWQVPAKVAGKPVPVLRAIRLFETVEKRVGGYVAFNLVGGRRWQAATAFTPKIGSASSAQMVAYLERQRQGMLLYREK